MSTTFNLTNTATEVNTAIQAVVGADTTPDAASANMVTSQGVFNHVNTQLGPFKGKTLTTSATGIATTDNDTSVPTSAAVNDAILNVLKVANYSLADRLTYFANTVGEIQSIIEDSNPANLGTITSGQLNLPSGTYIISTTGEIKTNSGSASIRLEQTGVVGFQPTLVQLGGGGNFSPDAGVFTLTSTAGFTLVLNAISGGGFGGNFMQYRNVTLTIIKLA
jgi:hypothetical protein